MQKKLIKIYKQIRFVIKAILRITFGFVVGLFIWRDKNIILIGNCPVPIFKINDKKEQFLHNTKYLYLYLNQNKSNLKSVYLCDEKDRAEKMYQYGLNNIYSRNSLKGIYYALRAKYWFTDYDTNTVAHHWLSYSAKVINLQHGIPLKKIIFDDERYQKDMSKIINKIWNILRRKEDYLVVNGEFEQNCYTTAFLQPKEHLKIIGSPRLDILLHDIPNAEIFMEKDFNNIKKFKEQGRKIFIYMPTFRDTGKDVSGWLNSESLQQLLKDNNAVLVCKLHPADMNFRDEVQSETLYFMRKNSDIYPVLKYSDALITDYSSVYFDYLLLDKPILYYPIDLEEYESTRGFYAPYEELTAGIKAYNEDELINAMQEVINGVDNYKEQRKALRDRMFKYQDGHNCERVVEWIKSLD